VSAPAAAPTRPLFRLAELAVEPSTRRLTALAGASLTPAAAGLGSKGMDEDEPDDERRARLDDALRSAYDDLDGEVVVSLDDLD
jgi:hypothetical protein